MHSDKHRFIRSLDIAFDDGDMFQTVVFLAERNQPEMAVGCRHVNLGAHLDRQIATQAIVDKVTDGHELQAPFVGLFAKLGKTGHCAVIAHDFH